MELLDHLYQGLIAGLLCLGKLAFIILPFMIIVEFAKHFGWLEIIAQRSKWFTGVFHLPATAALPVFAGLFIGIVSGSGVILRSAKEENYSRSTLTVLFVMVGICHSLVEETAIFIGLHVNIWIIAGTRFIAALIFAYLISRILEQPEKCSRPSAR